jgi:hypothetical protein
VRGIFHDDITLEFSSLDILDTLLWTQGCGGGARCSARRGHAGSTRGIQRESPHALARSGLPVELLAVEVAHARGPVSAHRGRGNGTRVAGYASQVEDLVLASAVADRVGYRASSGALSDVLDGSGAGLTRPRGLVPVESGRDFVANALAATSQYGRSSGARLACVILPVEEGRTGTEAVISLHCGSAGTVTTSAGRMVPGGSLVAHARLVVGCYVLASGAGHACFSGLVPQLLCGTRLHGAGLVGARDELVGR